MIANNKARSVPYLYRDYAPQFDSSKTKRTSSLGSKNKEVTGSEASASDRFPSKLGEILNRKEFSHIIEWRPHGRSFKIHDKTALEQVVLPKFFDSANYNSFVRLLNAWQFRRIKGRTSQDDGNSCSEGDFNSYYHELFLRGCPLLSERMRRLQRKNDRKAPVNIEDEPDFSKLDPLPAPDGDSVQDGVLSSHNNAVSPSQVSFPGNKKRVRSVSAAYDEGGAGRPCPGAAMSTTARALVTAPPSRSAGAGVDPTGVDLKRMLLLERLKHSENEALLMSALHQQQSPVVSAAGRALQHRYGSAMPWTSLDTGNTSHAESLLGMNIGHPSMMANHVAALQAARYQGGAGFPSADALMYPGMGAASIPTQPFGGYPADLLFAASNRSYVPGGAYFPQSSVAPSHGVGLLRDAAMKGMLNGASPRVGALL